MAETPIAGWYADPADGTQLRYWDGGAWTAQIRSATTSSATKTPRRRLPGIAIAGIVVAALLTISGFIVIIMNAGGDPDSTSTGTSTPGSETAPKVTVPDGWALFTSRSGAIQYFYDPAWTDVWTPELEISAIESGGNIDGVEMELCGSWLVSGSAFSGGTNLVVIATSDGTIPIMLGLQTKGFVQGNAASVGGEDLNISFDEGFTTASGYEAWRIDYTMTAYDTEMYSSVVAFQHDVTIGFAYIASLEDFDVWMPDFLTLADSLVVVKPPVSP